jgi:hypothetical protein
MSDKKISYFILSLALLAFIVCIFLDANWTIGDDYQFFTTTVLGKAPGIYNEKWGGRFWPLGLVDYSIMLFVPYGHTIGAHLAYNSIVMILSTFLLFSFMNKVAKEQYILNALFVLLLFSTSNFIEIHMRCIYSERMMFFTLSAFMLCYWLGENRRFVIYYILAFLAAAYTTYLKEPVFGMIAIVSLTNLVFRCKKLDRKGRIFNYVLMTNSAVYLRIYICRWFEGKPRALYHGAKLFYSDFSILNSVSRLIMEEPIVCIMFIVCFFRLYFVLVKKDRKHLFLDGLLFAGVGYACAVIVLMVGNHCLFPSLVLVMPSLAYWALYFLKKNKLTFRTIVFSLLFIAIPSIAVSVHKVKKNWFYRSADTFIAKEIMNRYLKGNKVIYIHEPSVLDFEYWLIIWNLFINYSIGKKINVIKKCSSLDEITENSLILYNKTFEQEEVVFSHHEKLRNFRLVDKRSPISIYLNEKEEWKRKPVR